MPDCNHFEVYLLFVAAINFHGKRQDIIIIFFLLICMELTEKTKGNISS